MRSQATRIRKSSASRRIQSRAGVSLTSLKALLSRPGLIKAERKALVVGFGASVIALTFTALVSQALVSDREPVSDRVTSLQLPQADTNQQQEFVAAVEPAIAAEPQSQPIGQLAEGYLAYLPEAENPAPPLIEQEIRIRQGDSLALIFDRAGYSPRQLYEVVTQSGEGDQLSKIYPGKDLIFRGLEDGTLIELEYRLSPLQSLIIRNSDQGYMAEAIHREPDRYPATRSGTIESSFYLAGQSAGLSDNLIMELAALFGWDIDFALEIRRGDSFRVIYEDLYLDGERIGHGDILAAEFVNQGRVYRSVRHTFADGSTDYYTPEGESMRKAFLRTPLDVFRISSHFDPYRKHPVLNTIRAHNGTDYAAATGTPIRATGDGRVVSARFSSSYGNVVEIQHGENYRTLYAHMNRFASGIRTGATVEQGQIIGYVGMTGLATGPHLHFEFYVNGTVRNPVTVELPNGDPLRGEELQRFQHQSVALLQLLDNAATRYAVGPMQAR